MAGRDTLAVLAAYGLTECGEFLHAMFAAAGLPTLGFCAGAAWCLWMLYVIEADL